MKEIYFLRLYHHAVSFELLEGVRLSGGEQVSQFFFLGLEVFLGMRVGRDLTGNALDNGDSGALESGNFVGIVRKQTYCADAEGLQHLGRESEFSMVRFESQAFVGFDGIEPDVLQLVRLKLCHQADPSALLLLVNKDARTLPGDHGKSHFQLLAAIATEGPENIASEALRMDTHQGRR